MSVVRRFQMAALCLAVPLVLAGCGVETMLKGQYYLNLEKYEEGIAVFQEQVRLAPGDARSHYYLGRCYLALGRTAQALSELNRAVDLAPGEADSWFWLGLAHGVEGDAEAEMRCYSRALGIDAKHLRTLIYLGHNRLEAGAAAEALGLYERALKLWPQAPEPLFNKALILDGQGRAPQARAAYKAYLDLYPSGSLALRAADGLNALGDFDYRNHLLGKRRVTLRAIRFKPESAELEADSLPSLKVVGAVLGNNPRLTLNVLAYQDGDEALGRARALAVRKYVLDTYPGLDPGRMRLSWFAVPERVAQGAGTYDLPQSLHLFATEAP